MRYLFPSLHGLMASSKRCLTFCGEFLILASHKQRLNVFLRLMWLRQNQYLPDNPGHHLPHSNKACHFCIDFYHLYKYSLRDMNIDPDIFLHHGIHDMISGMYFQLGNSDYLRAKKNPDNTASAVWARA